MRRSAGILLFRRREGELEVLLAHPGGPFWRKKDQGAWTLPKGEYGEDEDPLDAARREFLEETGTSVDGPFVPLGTVRQAGGKYVTAWAVEQDFDTSTLASNTFQFEWPPKSGRMQAFPEIDRAEWFRLSVARDKMLASQLEFLDRLAAMAPQAQSSQAD